MMHTNHDHTPNDITRPAHYVLHRTIEPILVIEDWALNYRLGNVVKYIARLGRKAHESRLVCLQKALWYLERELAYERAKTENP